MIEYLWVLCKQPGEWLVSKWHGDAYWIDPRDYHVRPDLNCGVPVIKRIGSGFIAQYYRFEGCPQ